MKTPSFLRISLLTGATIALSAAPALAGEFKINTLMGGGEEEQWKNWTYIANDTVSSLNDAGSALTVKAHEALNMEEASPFGRFGFALTVGQINTRFHHANSIFFGHEFAHFQNAHRFGITDHYFVDDGTGEEISHAQAYWNIFATGAVGGPATSRSHGSFDHDLHAEEGILSTLGGPNWQMRYTEDWIRSASKPRGKTVFDTTDFLINRTHMTAYANLDRRKTAEDGSSSGDLYKFARHVEPDRNPEDVLTDMTLYGTAATLISPMFWQSAYGASDYVLTGKTDFEIDYYQTRLGGVLWDVPQFLNPGGYTFAPTLYFKPEGNLAKSIGADDLLLSASYETAVMGEVDPELRLTVTGNWGAFRTDLGISGGSGGQFLEAEAGYIMNDAFSLNIGTALTKGSTLRGTRNMPTGDSATWAGVQFSF